MPRLPRSPYFWLASFLAWAAILWLLSSRHGQDTHLPPIPHFDKVAHFGYFFGGAGLLSAFLFRLRPGRPRWAIIALTVILSAALIGVLDEYHQSFTPGRHGNDLSDWIADVLGATCGFLTFRRLHRLLS